MSKETTNTEEATPARTIGEAKMRIMNAVAYVKKTGEVKKRGESKALYTFASEGDLLRALRGEMIAHGVTCRPSGIEPWPGPCPSNLVRAKYTFTFKHEPSGTEEECFVLGEGGDSGDKCCPKANTIAMKYALRLYFQIETGDDPDRDVQRVQHEAERAPSASFTAAKNALLKATNVDMLTRYKTAYTTRGDFGPDEITQLDAFFTERWNSLGGRRTNSEAQR